MLRRVISTLAILVMLPSAASARSTYCGTHMGFAQGPDQMVVGGQLQFNGIAPRMAFVPGIDYGFRDGNSVLGLNGDFHLNLTYDTTWQPYVGAGVSMNVWSEGNPNRVSQDGSRPGSQAILGVAAFNRSGGRFFTELKLGFGGAPETKLLAGWNMRGR